MVKYESLIVWVDWEDHSTLLCRPWFDHLGRMKQSHLVLPDCRNFAKQILSISFTRAISRSLQVLLEQVIFKSELTQPNSSREPKHFASFYRLCRYYSLLQKEQSMGKKQQESDKFLYYSSLSESTIESSIRPWIPCTPINVLEGERGRGEPSSAG